MTEQPPSAEALIKPWIRPLGLDDEQIAMLTSEIDALCKQRVSAETERCEMIAHEYLYNHGNPARQIINRIRAPAERPAPPIPELSVVRLTEAVEGIEAGTLGTIVHV